MKELLLKIDHLFMRTDGGTALSDFHLHISKGELLGLAGLNGSGKTALAHILSGQASCDSGNIYLNGVPVSLRSPKEARELGIYCIDHHMDLLMDFSVWENICFPAFGSIKRFYVDHTVDQKTAQKVIDQLELPLKVNARGWQLTQVQRRFVQLARAVASGAKLLLLDNISNDFTEKDTRIFLNALKCAARRGISVILISHRSDQLAAMDRVAVLRDGKFVGTIFQENYTKERLYSLMIGHEYQELLQKSNTACGRVVLDVQDFSASAFHSLSFTVCQGELLGITDLSNIDIPELLGCIMGEIPSSGRWSVDGRPLSSLCVKELTRNNVGILVNRAVLNPLLPSLSVEENTVFLSFKRLATCGMFLKRQLWEYACRKPIQDLHISEKTAKLPLKSAGLSKEQEIQLQLSRWNTIVPKALLCLELTQELDAFAKMRIWDQIKQLSMKGTAILIVSSDLAELSALCNRTIIMDNGHIVETIFKKQ